MKRIILRVCMYKLGGRPFLSFTEPPDDSASRTTVIFRVFEEFEDNSSDGSDTYKANVRLIEAAKKEARRRGISFVDGLD